MEGQHGFLLNVLFCYVLTNNRSIACRSLATEISSLVHEEEISKHHSDNLGNCLHGWNICFLEQAVVCLFGKVPMAFSECNLSPIMHDCLLGNLLHNKIKKAIPE